MSNIIKNLEYLHETATRSPWRIGEFSFMCKHMDAALIVKTRDLLPEFIELWKASEALDGTKPDGIGLEGLPRLFKAVDTLNAKATDLLN